MPEIRCLFARPSVAVHRALLAEPAFAGELYVVPAGEAELDAPPDAALTVVRLPDPEAASGASSPALARFGWLDWVLPAPALGTRLGALARETGAVLAWFYWHERGDDLYGDAVLLFTPTGRRLYARQVDDTTGEDDCAAFADDAAVPWAGAPFIEAMAQLGLAARTQYFVPEDQARFDWDRFRLASASAADFAGHSGKCRP